MRCHVLEAGRQTPDDLEKRLRFHHEMLPAGFSGERRAVPGCVIGGFIKRHYTGVNITRRRDAHFRTGSP